MTELNVEMRSACAVACPTAAARELEALSNQYRPPHEWLYSSAEARATVGPFSVDAVRTAIHYFHIMGGVDERYGAPRIIADPTDIHLSAMQRSIEEGRHILPEEVNLLKNLAAERARISSQFAAVPLDEYRRFAEATRPFLDEVATSLLDKDSEFSEPDHNLADIMDGRDQLDEKTIVAKDLFRTVKSIDQVHMLDQAPFTIARQALQACGGPRAYRRLVLPGGGIVCPIGSRRTRSYLLAQYQAEEPHP